MMTIASITIRVIDRTGVDAANAEDAILSVRPGMFRSWKAAVNWFLRLAGLGIMFYCFYRAVLGVCHL